MVNNMNHENYLKKCTDYILDLEKKVSILSSLNYYDINTSCEKFYMHLLKLVYGWNLKNINDEQNNAASIDLYDKDGRIAVQVTSDDILSGHQNLKKMLQK